VGRRAPGRRLKQPAALLVAAALLVGCTTSAADDPPATQLGDGLNAALTAGSLSEFRRYFPDDAQGWERARTWYEALTAGAGSIAQGASTELRVTTTFVGDRRPATQTIAYRLHGTDPVLAEVIRTQSAPLWALDTTDVTTAAESGTLLSSGLDEAAESVWATRLARAAAAVRDADVPGDGDWAGTLVVEVPRSDADFELITSAPASSASAITTCQAGTPRVVVSPEALELDAGWLDSTLVHEAVHVATDSACVAAGASLGWAVEGLAESVAARTDPATAARNRRLVDAELTAHGVPEGLPERLESLTDYALAQLAVDQVRARLGAGADDLLNRATHHAGSVTAAELRRITGWYLAELRRRAR